MKGIVIYKSRYGAAKQYAEWIAESLNVSAVQCDQVSTEQLKPCGFVIAGSSIYIGKILIKDWLTQHASLLKTKKLILFIVGAAPPSEKEKTGKYFTDNISADMMSQSKCFYLQGKSIHSELSFWDKILLKAGAKFAPTKEEGKAMLTEFNALRKENLDELLKNVSAWQK